MSDEYASLLREVLNQQRELGRQQGANHVENQRAIARVDAKVNRLVGEDGNEGAFAKLEERVSSLETKSNWVAGAGAALGGIVGFFGDRLSHLIGGK